MRTKPVLHPAYKNPSPAPTSEERHVFGSGYSVTVPAGVTFPMSVPVVVSSVNHTLPSGPAATVSVNPVVRKHVDPPLKSMRKTIGCSTPIQTFPSEPSTMLLNVPDAQRAWRMIAPPKCVTLKIASGSDSPMVVTHNRFFSPSVMNSALSPSGTG